MSIREVIVAVERRKGIIMRCHVTLEDLAYSLVYRWPEDDRGNEWIVAQKMCLEAMEGVRDPEQARAAFVAAAKAAQMLMVKEEYTERRTKTNCSPSTELRHVEKVKRHGCHSCSNYSAPG